MNYLVKKRKERKSYLFVSTAGKLQADQTGTQTRADCLHLLSDEPPNTFHLDFKLVQSWIVSTYVYH